MILEIAIIKYLHIKFIFLAQSLINNYEKVYD